MFWLVLGWCLVFDVQQVNFGADLRVALAADWVFLVGRVVGNGHELY